MTEAMEADGILVGYELMPWDTAACGFPVAQVSRLHVGTTPYARIWPEWRRFEAWRDAERVGLVSCRVPAECLRESLWLEEAGFRFLEMVYRPVILLESLSVTEAVGLEIARAESADVAVLGDIAERAFVTDRFSVDPRIARGVAGLRYRRWVESAFEHRSQRLYRITEAGAVLAFFITELGRDGTCHWHLTAVDPAWQGRGYGKRIWRAMMARARREGARRIETTISARNIPVIHLYAGLGFRFESPATTFHWVRG